MHLFLQTSVIILKLRCTFQDRLVFVSIQLFYLGTQSGIFQNVDVLVKHIARAVDVSNHDDLIIGIEELNEHLR